jgi:hypothetical protein
VWRDEVKWEGEKKWKKRKIWAQVSNVKYKIKTYDCSWDNNFIILREGEEEGGSKGKRGKEEKGLKLTKSGKNALLYT